MGGRKDRSRRSLFRHEESGPSIVSPARPEPDRLTSAILQSSIIAFTVPPESDKAEKKPLGISVVGCVLLRLTLRTLQWPRADLAQFRVQRLEAAEQAKGGVSETAQFFSQLPHRLAAIYRQAGLEAGKGRLLASRSRDVRWWIVGYLDGPRPRNRWCVVLLRRDCILPASR